MLSFLTLYAAAAAATAATSDVPQCRKVSEMKRQSETIATETTLFVEKAAVLSTATSAGLAFSSRLTEMYDEVEEVQKQVKLVDNVFTLLKQIKPVKVVMSTLGKMISPIKGGVDKAHKAIKGPAQKLRSFEDKVQSAQDQMDAAAATLTGVAGFVTIIPAGTHETYTCALETIHGEGDHCSTDAPKATSALVGTTINTAALVTKGKIEDLANTVNPTLSSLNSAITAIKGRLDAANPTNTLNSLKGGMEKFEKTMKSLTGFFDKLKPITGLMDKKFKVPNPAKITFCKRRRRLDSNQDIWQESVWAGSEQDSVWGSGGESSDSSNLWGDAVSEDNSQGSVDGLMHTVYESSVDLDALLRGEVEHSTETTALDTGSEWNDESLDSWMSALDDADVSDVVSSEGDGDDDDGDDDNEYQDLWGELDQDHGSDVEAAGRRRRRRIFGRRRRRIGGVFKKVGKVAKKAGKATVKVAKKVASCAIPKFGTATLSLGKIVNVFVKGLKALEKIPGFKQLLKLFDIAMKPIQAVLSKALAPLKKLVSKATLPGLPTAQFSALQTKFAAIAALQEQLEKFANSAGDKALTTFKKAIEPIPALPCSSQLPQIAAFSVAEPDVAELWGTGSDAPAPSATGLWGSVSLRGAAATAPVPSTASVWGDSFWGRHLLGYFTDRHLKSQCSPKMSPDKLMLSLTQSGMTRIRNAFYKTLSRQKKSRQQRRKVAERKVKMWELNAAAFINSNTVDQKLVNFEVDPTQEVPAMTLSFGWGDVLQKMQEGGGSTASSKLAYEDSGSWLMRKVTVTLRQLPTPSADCMQEKEAFEQAAAATVEYYTVHMVGEKGFCRGANTDLFETVKITEHDFYHPSAALESVCVGCGTALGPMQQAKGGYIRQEVEVYHIPKPWTPRAASTCPFETCHDSTCSKTKTRCYTGAPKSTTTPRLVPRTATSASMMFCKVNDAQTTRRRLTDGDVVEGEDEDLNRPSSWPKQVDLSMHPKTGYQLFAENRIPWSSDAQRAGEYRTIFSKRVGDNTSPMRSTQHKRDVIAYLKSQYLKRHPSGGPVMKSRMTYDKIIEAIAVPDFPSNDNPGWGFTRALSGNNANVGQNLVMNRGDAKEYLKGLFNHGDKITSKKTFRKGAFVSNGDVLISDEAADTLTVFTSRYYWQNFHREEVRVGVVSATTEARGPVDRNIGRKAAVIAWLSGLGKTTLLDACNGKKESYYCHKNDASSPQDALLLKTLCKSKKACVAVDFMEAGCNVIPGRGSCRIIMNVKTGKCVSTRDHFGTVQTVACTGPVPRSIDNAVGIDQGIFVPEKAQWITNWPKIE